MRIIASIYIILLAMMYIPVMLNITGRGLLLYAYWAIVASIAVIIAWLAARRWESWKGSSQAW